jgi:puromycin-sensitive aminopeptidase
MSLKSERVLLPENCIPTHYDLCLTPDMSALTFSCDMTINVNVTSVLKEITMHSKEIVIQSASIDGLNTCDINYDEKMTTVTLSFPNDVSIGNNKQLKISYTGILNGDMAGFYKSSYCNANGDKMIMASTQFEALDARRAFPCWDEPAVKATFKVSLIIENHLQALSNMPEIGIQHLPNGSKKIDFDISPIMSTYLLAWAIGEFDMVQCYTNEGVSIRIFCPPGRAPQGYFALDAGKRALEFYNDFFGIKYPLPKLDMLCVTEFAAGAMENWGLVTYREVDLMIDAEKASSQQKQRVAIVVAHELAHQWFGNLVTMEWWDGIWLNEGFAAFMEHFCVDSLYPEYKIWEQYTTDAYGHAQKLDALRTSHPVVVPIKHAEEVEQVFDAISYCKGSCCVRTVKNVIGLDAFRKG